MSIESLLPKNIQDQLKQEQMTGADTFAELIGTSGYVAPQNDIVIDAVVALLMGKNVLLKGPTGSGKTKFAETLSALFNRPMHMVNCSVDLDAESLLGFKTLDYQNEKQVIRFVAGPVINAMELGHFLYIDEVNMAKPETLPLINSVLDYRRTIANPFTATVTTAKKGFGVIAAINEGYIGTVPLNEALKNRFVVINVPYLSGDDLEELILKSTAIHEKDTANRFVRFSSDLVTAAKQGKLSEDASSIRALLDACDLSSVIPPARAIQRAIIDKLDEEREKDFVKNMAETLF